MVEQRPGLESGRARREDGGPAIERGIAGQASQAARVGFRSWCGGLQLEGQLRVTEQEPWQRVLARESHGSAGLPHASGPRTSPGQQTGRGVLAARSEERRGGKGG